MFFVILLLCCCCCCCCCYGPVSACCTSYRASRITIPNDSSSTASIPIHAILTHKSVWYISRRRLSGYVTCATLAPGMAAATPKINERGQPKKGESLIKPFRTSVSFWGLLETNYLEFEWLVPKTGLTLLGPQSRFGDKPLIVVRELCPHIWECGAKRVKSYLVNHWELDYTH